MLPILVKLGEAWANIIHEQLGKLVVRLHDEAEEFSMIVVHYLAKLFLEGEWLEIFPSVLLCLQDKYSILQLENFAWSIWDILHLLFDDTTQYHDVVIIETVAEVIGNPLRHFNFDLGPDAQLRVIAFDWVQEFTPLVHAAEEVHVFRSTWTRWSVNSWCIEELRSFAKDPLPRPDGKSFKRRKHSWQMIIAANDIEQIVCVVGGNRAVLPRNLHVIGRIQPSPVVNHEAPITRERAVSL